MLDEFFALHPVFTLQEFKTFLSSRGGSQHPETQRKLLAYHKNSGQILLIRKGLYATLPISLASDKHQIDPYLIASKMAEDATLAYHSALDLHGFSHSIFFHFNYLSSHLIRPFEFQANRFIRQSFPKTLIKKQRTDWGIIIAERLGIDIKITELERTVVDVLDRPNLSGGWEEIWRSLESIAIFNIDQCIEYALLLENATTIAKLGFFLEQNQDNLGVKEAQLKLLEKHIPSGYHYINRASRETGVFIKRWNLIIPEYIIHRGWEEPHVDF